MGEITEFKPSIGLSPELVEAVKTEVAETDFFGDFVPNELAIMEVQNPLPRRIYDHLQESSWAGRTEDEVWQTITGYLFAHRLLRYGSYNESLPTKHIDHFKDELRAHSYQPYLEDGRSTIEATIDTDYEELPFVVDSVKAFRFERTRYGTAMFLSFYKEDLYPVAEQDRREAVITHASGRAFREVSDQEADYHELCDEELSKLMETNPYLGMGFGEAFKIFREDQGEIEARRFNMGLVLGHRILRYSRFEKPLPVRSDTEIDAVFDQAMQVDNSGQIDRSKLEGIFKDRFASHTQLIELVYTKLSQPKTRLGVEQMLLSFADELDGGIEQIA